jgi:biopolymer transport protein ExbB/TolQ
MQGGKKLSSWNLFVKKVYKEGKAKNSNYEFKQALVDASKRKSEMGSMKNKTRKSMALAGGKSRRMAMAGGRSRHMAMAGGKSRGRSMAMAGGKSRRRK